MKKEDRPRYEPPQAKALSAFSVRGDGPLPAGFCSDGYTPVGDYCSGGDVPTQDPALCNPTGAFAAKSGCGTGNNAVSGCQAGSIV